MFKDKFIDSKIYIIYRYTQKMVLLAIFRNFTDFISFFTGKKI